MTDLYCSASSADAAVPAAAEEPKFYVVARRKFAVLFLATFSLYCVYWFYKNWDRYKENSPFATTQGTAIWPFMRAIFAIFFVHSLFRKIKLHGSGQAQVAAWSSGWNATLLVVLLIVSNALDRAASRSLGSPVTDVLALLILVPLLYPFLRAQKMINISCNDPTGTTNSKFTSANVGWIAFGSIIWCLALLGMTTL